MVTSCVHEKDMEIIAEVVYFQLYLAQEHNGQDHIQGQQGLDGLPALLI